MHGYIHTRTYIHLIEYVHTKSRQTEVPTALALEAMAQQRAGGKLQQQGQGVGRKQRRYPRTLLSQV